MPRLSRTERSAKFQQKKSTAQLLEVAEISAQEVPKPEEKRYNTPTSEQETVGYRQRRSVRLVPDLPPLTPASQWSKD